jgi:hypothetical protein
MQAIHSNICGGEDLLVLQLLFHNWESFFQSIFFRRCSIMCQVQRHAMAIMYILYNKCADKTNFCHWDVKFNNIRLTGLELSVIR